MQTQLNDLVLQSGTNIAEVVQAHGGEVTLNARLEKTAAQLADNTTELCKSVHANILSSNNRVKYFAHRGVSLIAPENTIPSFEMAGQLGFFGAETDLCITSDGVFVIMHDDTVDRTINVTGSVSSLTLSAIKSLLVDSGNNISYYPDTKVPTLEEYLKVCRTWGMTPLMELKTELDDEDYDILLGVIRKYQFEENCYVCSYSQTAPSDLRKKSLKLPLQLVLNTFDSSVITFLIANNITAISLDSNAMTKSVVDTCHATGIMVNCWTPNGNTSVQKIKDFGVYFITSDIMVER